MDGRRGGPPAGDRLGEPVGNHAVAGFRSPEPRVATDHQVSSASTKTSIWPPQESPTAQASSSVTP